SNTSTQSDTPAVINKFIPTGGVIAPIVVTKVTTTVNQIGSYPSACTNGNIKGILMTRNPRASMTAPPTRYITTIIITMKTGAISSCLTHPSTSNGNRVALKKFPNTMADSTS